MRLRREHRLCKAMTTTFCNHRFKKRTTDPLMSPCTHHCHAPDFPAGKQAGTADRVLCSIRRQKMDGTIIQPIPLQSFGHRLFFNEHLAANLRQRGSGLLPRNL